MFVPLGSSFPYGPWPARQQLSTQPIKQRSRSMKRILLAGLTVVAMSSATLAEPVQLNNAQMDSVTAGLKIRDVNVNFASRSEEHMSELQSLMHTSYAVLC